MPGVLFISHSRRDDAAAIKVRDWLKNRGWRDVFLDLDPEQGLTAGSAWQQELKQAGERCSGVLILLSPDWLASPWCRTEFLVADQLGKKIFPIFVAPTPFDDLPVELRAKFQMVDISSPDRETEGFDRLAIGLKRAGLDPRSFEWPPAADPNRPIYRGLQSLDEQDAAIFFGRDTQITEGMDALRRMRSGGSKRFLAILGASGSGKSSFLKAGLIARLRRDDENFVVLPVIRPERAFLSGANGLAASFSRDPAEIKTPQDIQDVFAAVRRRAADDLRRYAVPVQEGTVERTPSIVVPIDQAEELFAAENTEALHAIELLVSAVLADGNAVIVATIRSDAFGRMQESPALAEVSTLPFSLAPMPHASFKDVIEGPARLAIPPLMVEPALTNRLLEDLATDDALPLLAFTLERLLYRCRGKQTLCLADYQHDMGGLQGAILAAVEEAFSKAQRDSSLPKDRLRLEQLARAAFIPRLVQVEDAESEPKRRVEQTDALPQNTLALVRHFVDARLLISDHRVVGGCECDTIEVVHEAILRQWPALRSWISEERDALRALDGLRTAARDWLAHRCSPEEGKAWLVHGGGRLEEVEQLLSPAHFADALRPFEREYLAACRTRDNVEREHERNEIERQKSNIARARRLQRIIFAAIGAAVAAVLIAGFGIAELLKGIAVRSSDSLARLSEQASDNQDYEGAARYALSGLAGADWPVLGYAGARAERALRSADVLSRHIAVFRGHTGFVQAAAFSPEGTHVVTASFDRTARIWDARTGAQIAVLRGHDGFVSGAAYSPDGKRIVTASFDKTARIWDAGTGRQIAVLRGHRGGLTSAVYSPDGAHIVTASSDKTARVWDATTGTQVAVLTGHGDIVESAAYSPDDSRIVTTSYDKSARVWDARTGAQISILQGHGDILFIAAFSPDGKHIVAASADSVARVWDSATGAQVRVLTGHADVVLGAAYSPDGTRIATASQDRTARIWDAATGEQLAILRGHDDIVGSVAYSPDGRRIVTSSYDKTARIFDATTGTENHVFVGQGGSLSTAAYSPDGRHLVISCEDGTVRVWDAATGAQTAILQRRNSVLTNAAYSPDGKRVVTPSQDGAVRIWDAATGAQIAVLRGHRSIVNSAVYNRHGNRVVTASLDQTARVWNAGTGAQIAVLRGHDSDVISATYSPDGTRIVTASQDKTARIWDATTGLQIAVLRGHDNVVHDAEFNSNGTRIVTASFDKTARIWDVKTGAQIAVLRGHEDFVNTAAFSPDDTRIVTSSQDKTARVWDTRSGSELAVLRWSGGAVLSAAYSPDGAHILAASDDIGVRISRAPQTNPSWLSLSRQTLIERTCAIMLSGGLDHFTTEELGAAPDLDPALDANACHPPTFWVRLQKLILGATAL